MFVPVREALARLRSVLGALDPRTVRSEDAVALLDLVVEAERVCAAARTMLAARAADSGRWKREGHRSAASWVAAKTGVGVGEAVGTLETARRLEQLDATRQAFASGDLSERQTREIASAAAALPEQEGALLEAANERSLAGLREECRRVQAASEDEADRIERLRRGRYLRHWTDGDGAVRFDARLTPEDGATVIAALDGARERIFRDARRAGRREPYAAYAADALVALATQGNAGRGSCAPRATVHVVVDHAALTRGSAEPGERCEIPGIGPIPVASARAMLSDSILKVLVTKGSDVIAVAHAGRTIPARLRTALEARDPTCVVPGCDVREGLEIDHYRVSYADGGPTSLDNLARECRWHHYLKTHCGFRLTGGPGAWDWESPDSIEGVRGDARPPPAA